MAKKNNNWKVSLNKAETELIKLENELGDNKKALSESENATDKNAKSLDNFGDSANDAGQKTLKLGDLIKAILISEAIVCGLKSLDSAIMDVAGKFADFVSTGVSISVDNRELARLIQRYA